MLRGTRASRQKAAKEAANEANEAAKPVVSTTSAKTTGRKTAGASAKVETVKKVTSTKRKAASAVTYKDEDTESEAKKPAVKKRKVKGKEEVNMPPPARTAVESLKKAMHIGAHVSAAGGMCPISDVDGTICS